MHVLRLKHSCSAGRIVSALVPAVFTVFACGGRAEAQLADRPYVGGSVGLFAVSADIADGRSPASGELAGVPIRPWLDLEGEVVVPRRPATRTYGGDVLTETFAPPGSSQEERERLGIFTRFHSERDIAAAISGVVILHRPLARFPRVHVGLVAGIFSQRVTDRRDYTPVRVGSGVNPNAQSASARSEIYTRTIGGPTVGMQMPLTVTRRLSVVPDVRYQYGSLGDEINDAVHASLRVVWRF